MTFLTRRSLLALLAGCLFWRKAEAFVEPATFIEIPECAPISALGSFCDTADAQTIVMTYKPPMPVWTPGQLKPGDLVRIVYPDGELFERRVKSVPTETSDDTWSVVTSPVGEP